MSHQLWNALIRTHHITSRKKVTKLKQAATTHAPLYVLLRSGGAPGIMYVEGSQAGVDAWVGAVNRLRYKDYQLASRTGVVEREHEVDDECLTCSGFEETESVKDFGSAMQQRGVYAWWRKAMGYAGDDGRL